MRRSGLFVVVVLGVMAVLGPVRPADAGVRAPFADSGRRPLGPRVASGGSSDIATCVVNSDGTARCWGNRESITRQFGGLSNPFIPFTAPVTIEGVSNAVAVAVGDGHACALRSDGRVVCWGQNFSGQLGLGGVTPGPPSSTGVDTFDPTVVPNLTGVVNIAAGGDVTCAVLVDGTARCWGANSAGQLGNLTPSTPVPSPAEVLIESGLLLTGLVGIATDGLHTCGLTASGQVFCWGNNNAGQVDGQPTVNIPQLAPKLTLSNAVDLAAGPSFTCAVLTDGTARCWGINEAGQLGTGNTNVTSGTPQVAGLTGAIAIATSIRHACALRVDGTAACWGLRASGQLDGIHVFNSVQPSPIPVPGTTGAVAIATGASVSCALLVDDALRCWGFIGREADFDPIFGIATTPGVAPISGRGVTAGFFHSCARRAQGTVACWGSNFFGQLGASFPNDQLTPVTAGLTGASGVAAGLFHSCARRGNGTALCWGDNSLGQAGDTRGGVRPSPITVVDHFTFVFDPVTLRLITVPVPLSPVLGVATGSSHACAVLGGGSAACWGSNASGQLGNETLNDAAFPVVAVDVRGLPGDGSTPAVAVTAGNAHSCALLAGGGVRCWGDNGLGQVTGTPTTTPQLTPVSPSLSPALPAVVAIAAGAVHTCALQANGAVRCWGFNFNRQLGDGSVTDAVAIAAGGAHTCVVRVAGTAQCWGSNSSGQLGDSSFFQSTSPVTVKQLVLRRLLAVTGLVTIEAGDLHTCAIRVDGQPLCWGNNSSGQVGDDSTTNRNTASAVPSFRFNVDPHVALTGHGRVARVTALVNCPAGQQVQVRASLAQGESSGQGIAVGACTGGIERYEVTVPAHGRGSFVAGPAVAEADAIIRDHGHVVDTQEWTRAVEIASGP